MALQRPTRERIIDEAMRLFGERGYAGTSIKNIESAAGLSGGGGGLYRHFLSKQALLDAGVQRQIRTNEQLLGRLQEKELSSGSSRDEQLRELGHAGIDRLERERDQPASRQGPASFPRPSARRGEPGDPARALRSGGLVGTPGRISRDGHRRRRRRPMDYLRSLFATFVTDPDDVEARGTLAFAFIIGNHFMAADHGGRSRQDVIELVADRLGLG